MAALAVICAACDDDKMEWGTPDGHEKVDISDIPLTDAEIMANYDYIKNYAQQYWPNSLVGLGLGADLYTDNADYKKVADENYQMFTTGNAMKMGSMVKSNGSIDFTTVDAFLDQVPDDIKIYGHNFIWHTQQPQDYLKSLIAPEMKVVSDSESGIANILSGDASDFEGGTSGGWGSWGSNKESADVVDGEGVDGSKALVLVAAADGNFWEAQCAYTFDEPLDSTKTYVIKFQAKSSTSAGQLQFQYQNGTTYGSQGAYTSFEVGQGWTTCEKEFKPAYDDVNRILINFGKVGGTYYIDNVEFGEKIENTDPMTNVLAGDNSDFEGGTKGNWGSWGNSSTSAVSEQGQGRNSDYCLVLSNPSDGSDYYVAQCAYTFDDPFTVDETYVIQFYAKADVAGAGLQFCVQNSETYSGEGYANLEVGTDWTLVEHEYTCSKEGMNRILINFGKYTANFYIDDIKWGVKNAENKGLKATTITYVIKSAEQKKALLDNAMEQWIKAMFEHVNGDQRFVAWDVVNEPISDGGGYRGINGVFGGTWTEDDVVNYDAEPTETETEGLKLNWASSTGNKHFYWGYYMGFDYAVKAFQYSRKYADENGLSGVKLFVNDYNLETNPTKCAELVQFANDIDAANGSPIVDGIGTQMHITAAESDEALATLKEKVDAQFKTLAASGKLVRITEFDVAFSKATTNPSSTQLKWQSETYKMVISSYVENVPEAQRHGVTLWTLSDNEDEHEYWLNGDSPNVFDSSYNRKEAYRGVCDAIAGFDISTTFSGDDWINAYKNNDTTTDESSSESDSEE